MDMQALKYFLAVARCEHVTKAARSLHLSQPALTKAIHDLERELGVSLFEHVGRNIRITPAGAFLKEYAEPLVEKFEALPTSMALFEQGENHVVRLSVHSASALVIEAVAGYRATHPQARFSLSQNDEEAYDLFIDTMGGARNALPHAQTTRCSWKVFEEPICVAVPADSAYGKTASLASLVDEGFICLAGSRPFREVCDSLCAAQGFEPRVVFESDNPSVVQKMIALGFGVGFWPLYSWGAVAQENVRLVTLRESGFARSVCVGLARENHTVEAEQFYQYLIERLQRAWSREG